MIILYDKYVKNSIKNYLSKHFQYNEKNGRIIVQWGGERYEKLK